MKSVLMELAAELVLFAAGTSIVSLLYRETLLVTALLVATGTVGLYIWHEKDDVYFFVVGAFLGPLAEIVHVSSGAWQYATPHFLGLPVWLIPSWGLFAILLRRISCTLAKVHGKK